MFFEIYTLQGCILSLQKEKNALDMSLQKSTVCQTTGRSWLQESPKRFKDYRIPTIRYLFDCSAWKCLSSFQAIPDSGRCHLLPTSLHLSQLTHTRFTSWRRQWHPTPVLLPGKSHGWSRLQSMGSPRVWHDWVISLSLFTFMHWRRKWQPTPVFLPGESQGQRSLVGCRLWGRRVRHDWSDLAAEEAAGFPQILACSILEKVDPYSKLEINIIGLSAPFPLASNWFSK